jgi:parallel beta-helix repeat protein
MRNSADFYLPDSPTAGIQEAIDSLPRRGGCVVVPPGTFLMKRSIHLRSNVSLRGGGAATLLRRPPQARSALARSAKPGDTEIEVASPQGFEVGCEVTVMDQDQRGWYVTHAIITQIKAGIFVLDHPLQRPYDVNKNAVVINYFPVLTAQAQSNISIEDVTIDGDLDNNPGPESDFTCAAIHFWNVADSRIVRCTVRDFPSDGIGLQGGGGNHVTGCLVENCRGQGFHPGTGLKSSIFTDNIGRRNTGDGLYFCMEVEHCVFSNNVFHENKASGIGGVGDGGDRHNIIMNNMCFLNGQYGINAFNGADNSITNNICKDNSQSKAGAYSGIILRDTLRTSVVGNRCLDSQDRRTQKHGIEEAGKSDYNLITSNHCLNNLQGGITTCGPHTLKAQNLE